MPKGYNKPPRPAKGIRPAPDRLLKIGCRFDEDTFKQISERAQQNGTSFSEQVRILVEWGLEAQNEHG